MPPQRWLHLRRPFWALIVTVPCIFTAIANCCYAWGLSNLMELMPPTSLVYQSSRLETDQYFPLVTWFASSLSGTVAALHEQAQCHLEASPQPKKWGFQLATWDEKPLYGGSCRLSFRSILSRTLFRDAFYFYQLHLLARGGSMGVWLPVELNSQY